MKSDRLQGRWNTLLIIALLVSACVILAVFSLERFVSMLPFAIAGAVLAAPKGQRLKTLVVAMAIVALAFFFMWFSWVSRGRPERTPEIPRGPSFERIEADASSVKTRKYEGTDDLVSVIKSLPPAFKGHKWWQPDNGQIEGDVVGWRQQMIEKAFKEADWIAALMLKADTARVRLRHEAFTEAEAEPVVRDAIERCAERVDEFVRRRGWMITRGERVALVSFDFNTGDVDFLILTSGSLEEVWQRSSSWNLEEALPP